MNPVRASHHRGVFVLVGTRLKDLHHPREVGDDDEAALLELQGIGGVEDIRGGESHMDEAGVVGPHVFAHAAHEGDHIVAGDGLDFRDACHIESGPGADVLHAFQGDSAQLVPGLAGGELHLEPFLVTVLVRPDVVEFCA